MSAMPQSTDPVNYSDAANLTAASGAPLLSEMPKLLEYRAGDDPEVEFIPKTVAGFCFGAMAFGFCLNLAESLITLGAHAHAAIASVMITRFAFMLGVTGVAASLLLVGLRVRADNSKVDLYSRHWLNSICTGSVYALMIWGPWFLYESGMQLMVNRFLAAAVWMALMAFPAVAAKWTIGPHKQLYSR